MKRGLVLPALLVLHGGGDVYARPRWLPSGAAVRHLTSPSSDDASVQHPLQPRAWVPLLEALRLRAGAIGDIDDEGGEGGSRGGPRRRRRRRKSRSDDADPSTVDEAASAEPELESRMSDGDDGTTTAGDSALQPDDNSSPGTTKKKKRRKRAPMDPDAGGRAAIDAASEAQDASQSDDAAPASKAKRRRRRVRQNASEVSDEGASEPVDTQSDVIQEESFGEGVNPQTDIRKQKRRRKRRNTASELPSTDVDSDQPPTSSIAIEASVEIPESIGAAVERVPLDAGEAEPSRKKKRRRRMQRETDEGPELQTDDAEDLPPSLAIDASIDIPGEEVVPESIGAAFEVDENMRIEPLEDKEEAVEASSVVVSVEVEDVAESSPETLREAGGANIECDGAEEEISEPTATEKDHERAVDDRESLETTVSIDASIEVPGEEIVPESVGGSVEVDEGLNDIEPMEDNSFASDAASLTLAIGTEENSEAGVVAAEDASAETDVAADEEQVMMAEVVEADSDEAADVDSTAVVDGTELPSAEQSEADADIEDEPIEEEGAHNEAEELDVGEMEEGANADDSASAPNYAAQIEDEELDEGGMEDETDQNDSNSPIGAQTDAALEEESGEDEVDAEEVPSDLAEEESQIDAEPEAVDEFPPVEKDAENTETEQTDQTTNDRELDKMDDDCLTVSIVTWNLGEAAPPEHEALFFRRFRKNSSGEGSDLVMIGAQECEEIKPRRTEGHRSRHLRRMGIQMLGKEYVPLAIHSLGGIQCALYCHRDVLGEVEMINIADVTCGIGNVLHNKGAIGVYLKMKRQDDGEGGLTKSSRMLFVTSHLAAHVKNVDARNDDFKRIVSELEAQAPPRFLRPRRNPDGSPAECDGTHLLSSMDHIFFSGDLNYRIDLPREYVERCLDDIKRSNRRDSNTNVDALMKKLLRRDQLLQTMSSGQAFPDFNEGKIAFLPTFKFDKGTSNYDTSHKQRVPAWTDRILFRSSKVSVLEYQSADEAKHSDHRPVFGTYQVGWGLTEKSKPKGFARKPKRSRSRKKKE